ncbi:MAG: hypothetical protein V4710_21440 [Verrucomicrobiota bacterium]
MKLIPGLLALLLIAYFSFRGLETFNLLPIAGGVWAVAFLATLFLLPQTASKQEMVRSWLVFGGLWLVAATILFTSWPLRIGPTVYRARFEGLAHQISSGNPVTMPQWIGPYKIERGETERGFVCLWLELNPAGRSGYIYGAADKSLNFNVSSLIWAGGNWHFLVED